MDIGTAKQPVAERRGVPHHLLDLLDVTEPASVAEFQRWARERDRRLPRPGRHPGAGRRLRRSTPARSSTTSSSPAPTPSVRAALEAELDEVGSGALHRRLAEQSTPRRPRGSSPSNGRRVVRALEVIAITGRPFSASLPELDVPRPDTVQIGVDIPRPILDERIALRVDRMWEAGPRRRGPPAGRSRACARGVRRPGRWATSRCSPCSTGSSPRRRPASRPSFGTRRFARRQDSWFRKDPRITWVGWDDPDRVDAALSAVRATAPA